MPAPNFEVISNHEEVMLKMGGKFYYFSKAHYDIVKELVKSENLTLTIHPSVNNVWRVEKSPSKVIECTLTACMWEDAQNKKGVVICAVEVKSKWLKLFMDMDKSFFDERLEFITRDTRVE
jgi:hypothetical protein